jgi:ABC-type branched-subunit amino acid transport system substrate-binding protein
MITAGVNLYQSLHGRCVANRTIEIISRDSASGPSAAVQAVQDLTMREKVDVLLGFVSRGEALAVAPLIDQRPIPTIVLRDRLRIDCLGSFAVIQAWNVDPGESWPDGRD